MGNPRNRALLLAISGMLIGVLACSVFTPTEAPPEATNSPPAPPTQPAPPTEPPAPTLPQECGKTEVTADYGPVTVGSVVMLGHHRAVDGDDNWAPEMNAYVGHVSRVTRLSGVDGQGCPGVRVELDGGQWFWRLRDLTLSSEQPEPPPTVSASTTMPQECGETAETANYGPVSVGTIVILGRHREVDGDDNWADEMDSYVGMAATVTRLSGVDMQGCPGVRVDLDDGEWFWRLRDLSLP
jgi:hypothetical protein